MQREHGTSAACDQEVTRRERATQKIAMEDPDALVVVVPSDQHILDVSGFHRAVHVCLRAAARGPITTLGITPTRPETGYGYVERSDEFEDGAYRVKRFVEKPDEKTAEAYLAGGRHFWNAGMFFFRAQTLLDAVEAHLPKLHAGLQSLAGAIERGADEAAATVALFDTCEATSIDYGIMERVEAISVVPADIGWSDLGSWQSVWELAEKDADENASLAVAEQAPNETPVYVDARGNLVFDQSSKSLRQVALIGVEDLCVVQTDEALLIMPRAQGQKVRDVVEELNRRGAKKTL
jgi:mannose-1-phosphate guanylyltransferase